MNKEECDMLNEQLRGLHEMDDNILKIIKAIVEQIELLNNQVLLLEKLVWKK